MRLDPKTMIYDKTARVMNCFNVELASICSQGRNDQEKAEIAYYGGRLLLYLVRGKADPEVTDEMLASVFHDFVRYYKPADLEASVRSIVSCWELYGITEKMSTTLGCSPISSILDQDDNLQALIRKNNTLEIAMKLQINSVIDRNHLAKYAPHRFEVDIDKNGSIISYFELTNEKGQTVKYEFMDLIRYERKEYVCLRERGKNQLTILLAKKKLFGKTEYLSVDDDRILNAVYHEFCKRNPDLV